MSGGAAGAGAADGETDDDSVPFSWTVRDAEVPPGPCAMVDIDGVISDAAGRQHFLNEPPKDWDAFFDACDQDPPIEASFAMLNQLSADLAIILLTARPSRVHAKTLAWLRRHNPRWDLLIVRSELGDTMSAQDYKVASLRELRRRGFDVKIAFEDDPMNVERISELDIPCVYIHSGYYEDKRGRSPMG